MLSKNVLKSSKLKLETLRTPKNSSEIVMITDSSDLGGGSTIFQWQTLSKDQIPEKYCTSGANPDGTF